MDLAILNLDQRNENDIWAGIPSPNCRTTPTRGLGASIVLTRISPSTRQVFSGTRAQTHDTLAEIKRNSSQINHKIRGSRTVVGSNPVFKKDTQCEIVEATARHIKLGFDGFA
ncbi:hypothetical protein TNCV_3543961 [Trichonephila clavipes]|nr:hypothetical protein TNCV_3543961 [Trichonephila clavipes]